MRILLDTYAISELRQKAPRKSVLDAINAVPSENLFLSVVTLGELAKGISLLAKGQRKNDLQSCRTAPKTYQLKAPQNVPL